MKEIIDAISNVPIFSGLPSDQLNLVRKIALDKTFENGEFIFSEGDEGNGFYIIITGMVKIFKVSTDGKEQILRILGKGEPFGEVPVFIGQQFPAHAEAITKTHVLFFPRKDFIELIAANPSLALNMLAVLSIRLRQFTVQIGNLSLKEVPARLASYLIYMANEGGREDLITLNISKTQLASLLGTVPETLSRVFSRMSSRNIIKVDGPHVWLLNRRLLQDLAEYGKKID